MEAGKPAGRSLGPARQRASAWGTEQGTEPAVEGKEPQRLAAGKAAEWRTVAEHRRAVVAVGRQGARCCSIE